MSNSDAEDIDLDKVSPATLKAYVKSTLEAPGRRWSPQLEQLRKEGTKLIPLPVWHRNNLIAEIVMSYFERTTPSGVDLTLFEGWTADERKRLNELCRTPTHGGIVPTAEDRDKLLEWEMCARAIFDEMKIKDAFYQPHALRLKVLEVFKRQNFDLRQWSDAAKSVAAFLKIEPGDSFMPNHMRGWLVDYFNQHQPDEILKKLGEAEQELINWRSFAFNVLKEMGIPMSSSGVLAPLRVGNLVLPWIINAKSYFSDMVKSAQSLGITK